MISPAIDASGSSLPRTAHSISRAFGTAASITIFRSYCSAIVHRVVELSGVLRLRNADARTEVGRLHENRKPQLRARRAASRRRRRASIPVGARPRTGRRADSVARNSVFITALSMPTAEPRTPAPTYGTLASSSSPCTVPSSPNGPCSTGKTTSMEPAVSGGGRVDRLQADAWARG